MNRGYDLFKNHVSTITKTVIISSSSAQGNIYPFTLDSKQCEIISISF